MRSWVVALVGGAIIGFVVGAVVAPRLPDVSRSDVVRIESFQRSGDPRQIIVVVVVGLGDKIVEATASENNDSVTPIVRVTSPAGARPAIGILVPTAVVLDAPLGTRSVVDQEGRPVRDLGTYEPPREPPIDLGEIGIIDGVSFASSGDTVDLAWKTPSGASRQTLADLRGSTVVLLSRTSFSGEAKMSLLALEGHLASLPASEAARIVVVPITLNEDPARAAVGRPSKTFRPLLAEASVTGPGAPEILRFASVPVMWFVDPAGLVRHRIEGRAASAEDITRGLALAR